MPKDAGGSNGDPCRSLKDVLERASCLGSVSASFGKAATKGVRNLCPVTKSIALQQGPLVGFVKEHEGGTLNPKP